jgi:uncharacterized protein involved in exopolysaccharide biosynthesis
MDLNSMVGTSTSMSSDLYPDVVQSYPFLQRLLEHKFSSRISGENSTLQDVLKTGQAKSWVKKVVSYTIRLPWTLKSMLFTKKVVHAVGEGDLIVLTSEDQEVYDKLTDCIEINVDKNNGLVSISVELEDPMLAAQVTQKSLDVLHQMVIEYKTKQVRENLIFIKERYQEKRSEFEGARKALNSYRDAHRNIITERTGAELQDLELEYNLASNVFQMLAQQVEQANIAVKKETPVFSVIDPVKVPLSKSSPNIGKNLFFSLIVGGLIVVMIITGKIVLFQIKH